jgi:predicted P-loop ATPase
LSKKRVQIDDKGWPLRLVKDSRGRELGNVANTMFMLRHDEHWREKLRFNQSSLRVECVSSPAWRDERDFPFAWSDADTTRLAAWLQLKDIPAGTRTVGECVHAIASENGYHPIRNFLDSLVWDRRARLDAWLSVYLGVEKSEYSAAVGVKWMIQAVARIFKPGCKADACLIVEGPQGSLKSSAFRVLGHPWFSDALPDLSSRDSLHSLRGVWIQELPELDAMAKAEVSRIKAFMSRAVDRFRLPYGHAPLDWARECVFVATTNEAEFLRDPTGGRRFWPVRCGTIDLAALTRDRDQLMAEAVVRFRKGETWWLDSTALVKLATTEQEDRFDGDPWEELIAPFIAERLDVSIGEILGTCIKRPMMLWTQSDKNRVGRTLRALGCKRHRAGSRGAREWRWLVSTSTKGD